MTETPRENYGQGAQGEPVVPTRTRLSFGKWLRYQFDNSLSKASAFVGYAFLLLIVLSMFNTAFNMWIQTTSLATQQENPDFWELFLRRMWSTLGDVARLSWADRFASLLAWASSTAVNAIVIGFVATGISSAVQRLKAGKSPVVSTGHTLILGWSNRVFPILKELAVAGSNLRKPTVVIFADVDRLAMEDEINSRAGDLGKLRIITRKGDPTNPGDLVRANIAGAKSIIILDADESGDATVVSTVLAVKSVVNDPTIPIVAEVDDAQTGEALTSATRGQVQTVRSHDVIARVTAQASRQPGLSTVILDLLDFDGDEIYFASVPALDGKTYGDALLAFNGASVIGFRDAKGVIHLNPKASTTISKGAQIIAIAEDDDKVVYTGVVKAKAPVVTGSKSVKRSAEHLLVIGWSSMGHSVISELASFLPKGSTVHVVANPKFVDPAELKALKFPGLVVTYSASTGDIDELIAAAEAKHYDEVIVLGYRNAISETEADAQTMLTMLQMNTLFEDKKNKVHPTRLVAEILDSRKAELARVAAVDDLVISDNLAALVVAQISENPTLSPVFADLFDADGASVNMRPIEEYAPLKKKVAFSQLVAAGVANNESVIGYRVAADAQSSGAQGVILNPSKGTEFTPAAGDSLIVVGNV
ncbi:MAG: CASTOR/POLLUX-related putative ion channel [Microbacteriaceae bacterium]